MLLWNPLIVTLAYSQFYVLCFNFMFYVLCCALENDEDKASVVMSCCNVHNHIHNEATAAAAGAEGKSVGKCNMWC